MSDNFIVLNSDDVAITEQDEGYVDPGAKKFFEFQYQNISGKTLTGIKHKPYSGFVDDDFINNINRPIAGIEIIRQTNQGSNQIATIAKEDEGAELTAFEQRIKCFRYSGGTYTEVSSGAVSFMASPSDKIILLSDQKILNIRVKLGTIGSYTGFTLKISQSDGSYATPSGLVDGTSGLSVADGVIKIDAASAENWAKIKISGTGIDEPVWAYAAEFGCTGVTTQAISEADGLYWEYAYLTPYHFLYGDGAYYRKSDPTYVAATPEYEYGNLGMVVFQDNPLDTPYGSYTLACDISYKLPQVHNFVIDATGANTVTVTIDGGSPSSEIGVQTGINPVTGLYYSNTNIVPGVDIFLNELESGDQGEFTISEMLKYLSWSLTEGDYQNKDIDLEDMDNGYNQTIYGEFSPPMNAEESGNEWNCELFVEGT